MLPTACVNNQQSVLWSHLQCHCHVEILGSLLDITSTSRVATPKRLPRSYFCPLLPFWIFFKMYFLILSAVMYFYVSNYRRTLNNTFTCYEEFFMTSHVVPCNSSDGRVESPHFYSVRFGCDIKLWFSCRAHRAMRQETKTDFHFEWAFKRLTCTGGADRPVFLTTREKAAIWILMTGHIVKLLVQTWRSHSGRMLANRGSVTQMLWNKHVTVMWHVLYLKSGTCHKKHLKI